MFARGEASAGHVPDNTGILGWLSVLGEIRHLRILMILILNVLGQI